MKKLIFFRFTNFMVLLFLLSCGSAKTEKALISSTKNVNKPHLKIAPEEYAILAEKAIMNLSNFEYDIWSKMLSDSVEYSFPNDAKNTRTTIVGKSSSIKWWKNWKVSTATKSMTLSRFSHFPLIVSANSKAGYKSGIYVISYFSSKMIIEKKITLVDMNFITHFDANKKIDKYITYFESTFKSKTFEDKKY